jgi:hypothetical protein
MVSGAEDYRRPRSSTEHWAWGGKERAGQLPGEPDWPHNYRRVRERIRPPHNHPNSRDGRGGAASSDAHGGNNPTTSRPPPGPPECPRGANAWKTPCHADLARQTSRTTILGTQRHIAHPRRVDEHGGAAGGREPLPLTLHWKYAHMRSPGKEAARKVVGSTPRARRPCAPGKKGGWQRAQGKGEAGGRAAHHGGQRGGQSQPGVTGIGGLWVTTAAGRGAPQQGP